MSTSAPAKEHARLLHCDGEVRRKAVDHVRLDRRGLYALRQVLLIDDLAPLRARAALRLGYARDTVVIPWLREALADPMASVRDAAYASVARVAFGWYAGLESNEGERASAVVSALISGACEEPTWWVRRTAVRGLTLAATSERPASDVALGEAVVEALHRALEDPFWRVRYAAAQGLALIEGADPARRHRPTELLVDDTPPPSDDAAAPWRLDGASLVDNEDPAVVTSHLQALDIEALDPRELVCRLADPHEPLREVASRRLSQFADPQALTLALRWLDEPLIPHAAETTRKLLRRLGGEALPLAEEVIARGQGEGALCWALELVGRHGEASAATRAQIAALAEHPQGAVRRGVLRARATLESESLPVLFHGLADRSPWVRELAIERLLRFSDERAVSRLRELEAAEQSVVARHGLVDLYDRHALLEQLAAVGEGDAHAAVRAQALAALGRHEALEPRLRELALADDDPWIRAAALDIEASRTALASDEDIFVQRHAATCLVRRAASLSATTRQEAARDAARSVDPWIRARAARLVEPEADGDAGLVLLLDLSRDEEPMVRAAAVDPLRRLQRAAERLRTLIATGELPMETTLAAYTQLAEHEPGAIDDALAARAEGESAAPENQSASLDGDTDVGLVAHLRALQVVCSGGEDEALVQALVAAEEQRAELSRVEAQGERWQKRGRQHQAPEVSRRQLGATGLEVAPLAISGAHQLHPSSLAKARREGVNLFFWEPRYTSMTRFLRDEQQSFGTSSDPAMVVAGSYHADYEAIAKDVDLCLRRLRRDSVDVFLLFWARSPERLAPSAFAALERLKAEGKIKAAGFSTHHRELAVAALRQQPWDVLMTRHNGAHVGAERELFPLAEALGVGVLTFSALCYGRMLKTLDAGSCASGRRWTSSGGLAAPTAADCYRYSLAQPSVAACISAPRRAQELAQNLEVLRRPALDDDAREGLLAHGERVYHESKRFNALLRAPEDDRTREAVHRAALRWLDGRDVESATPGTSDAMDVVVDERRPGALDSIGHSSGPTQG